MNPNFSALTKQDGDRWIGWVEEVPGVNARERTREELTASRPAVLAEALEINRASARRLAMSNFVEEPLSR